MQFSDVIRSEYQDIMPGERSGLRFMFIPMNSEPQPFDGITLLGLGPGDPSLLTLQAWSILQNASEVILRTREHPVVSKMPDTVQVQSFDELTGSGIPGHEVCAQIVEKILAMGARPGGVIYAVPGHPFIGEAAAPEVARRARLQGLPLRIVGGISFLEPVCAALEISPAANTALADAVNLAAGHIPAFPPDIPAIVTHITNPAIARSVMGALAANYPGEHIVHLVHAPGTPQVRLEELPLSMIDQSVAFGSLTALYIPPLARGTSFEAFQEVIAHLRAPDGCPWDREQTHKSLRSSLLEETYEVLAAMDEEDPAGMCEEFGDLLLQIVLNAQIATEYQEFRMADVFKGIHDKIIRRHPHVFGEVEVSGTENVLQNWERLKAKERAASGKQETSLLSGISPALPALVQAEQYGKRAQRVGFDWTDIQGVWDKLEEEIRELRQTMTAEETTAELGDVLFAAVNLARWLNVDPESALREANLRFRQRFEKIEEGARRQGRSIGDLSLDEMEEIWQAAKKPDQAV
jgi:tetrapyrrole methylase family protein/MazG family protein